jgi:hypothetical protein
MQTMLIPALIATALAVSIELYIHVGRCLSRRSGDSGTGTDRMSCNTPDTPEMTGHVLLQQDSRSITGRNGSLIRKWIITHTDFDGFTSGALLMRLLGRDSGILFSSPGALLANLNSAGADLIDGDTLFIADLALQPHLEHEFSDTLNNLRKHRINVIWIDHHEWPAGLVERIRPLCAELLIDPAEKTAAAIIRRILPQDDAHADRLLRFVQGRSDQNDTGWDNRWRAALAELSYRRDADMSETLLRLWANDEPGGVLLNFLARQGIKREQATKEIAAHRHRREKTCHSRTLLVIDVRARRLEHDEKGRTLFVVKGFQPSVMVGQHACRIQQGDFCLILWEDFRFSLYRGRDDALDFGSLFGERNINKTSYRIGGHRYAVSIRVSPTLRARIRALFQWRPGPEAETFIHYLKERF